MEKHPVSRVEVCDGTSDYRLPAPVFSVLSALFFEQRIGSDFRIGSERTSGQLPPTQRGV